MMLAWLFLSLVFSTNFAQISLEIANSSPNCTIYNSQSSKDFDIYHKCLQVADQKSRVGYFTCETAKKVTEILKNCVNINEFEQIFIENTKINLTLLNNTIDTLGWSIWGIGVAFEPYIFPKIQLYYPYQRNKNLDRVGQFSNLIDDYNYYTDCLSEFGDACTWYHQAKIITYYQEKGGVWIMETENFWGNQTRWGFYTPVVVDGRFYGVLAIDAIEP